jgi:hypothetical protein
MRRRGLLSRLISIFPSRLKRNTIEQDEALFTLGDVLDLDLAFQQIEAECNPEKTRFHNRRYSIFDRDQDA